jgi:hypothetical protein
MPASMSSLGDSRVPAHSTTSRSASMTPPSTSTPVQRAPAKQSPITCTPVCSVRRSSSATGSMKALAPVSRTPSRIVSCE